MKKTEKNEIVEQEFQKLQTDLAEEIRFLITAIKADIEWLEKYFDTTTRPCASINDVRELALLKNVLERNKREIRERTYRAGDVDDTLINLLNKQPLMPSLPSC